jgi:hypothetical protein
MSLLLRNVALLAGVGLGMSVMFACSSDKTESTAPTPCQDSLCAANNKCIDNGKNTECRLQCAKQEDCPSKYQCVVTPKGDVTYCAPLEGYTAQITPKDQGQWGAPCKPNGGLDANPDCDSDQNFWCYGENPTDGEAFCTQYQCNSDAECKGGYWCATINAAPDVRTTKHSVGVTTTACLPRRFCSPCKSDVDCPSDNGVPQHCVAGSDDATFCAPECQNSGNCRLDATCESFGDFKACKPRAGLCKGDGSLCSPCYSDADCPNGICLTASYSREKYCGVKSAKPCAVVNDALVSDCPSSNAAGAEVSCETTHDNQAIPKDYCFGLISFGGEDMFADGCWSRDHH